MVQGTWANSLTGTCSDPHRPGSQRSGSGAPRSPGLATPCPVPWGTGLDRPTPNDRGPGTVLPYSPGFQDRVELGPIMVKGQDRKLDAPAKRP